MSPAGYPSDDQLDAATWCGHLVPAGSGYAFLADHHHELLSSELFADLTRDGGGHPSVPAEDRHGDGAASSGGMSDRGGHSARWGGISPGRSPAAPAP